MIKEYTLHLNSCVYPRQSGWAGRISGTDGNTDLAGGFRHTTDNRVLLHGLVRLLESVPAGSAVTVRTPFAYIGRILSPGFLEEWHREPDCMKRVLYPDADLWERMLALVSARRVAFSLVRPDERDDTSALMADRACVEANRTGLPEDEGAYLYIIS